MAFLLEELTECGLRITENALDGEISTVVVGEGRKLIDFRELTGKIAGGFFLLVFSNAIVGQNRCILLISE